MPARPGAFNANFDPVTLNAFKSLCRSQGLPYTKVLERLAEIYIATNGDVLDAWVCVTGPRATETAHQDMPTTSNLSEDLLGMPETLKDGKTIEAIFDSIESLETRVQRLEQSHQ